MNLVARKDNKNLARLNNIEVDTKVSALELLKLVDNLENDYHNLCNKNVVKLNKVK